MFSVGGILRDLPSEATACYFDDIGGRACPGWEDEVAAADAKTAPKLAAFVATATGAVTDTDPAYVMDQDRIAGDLAVLRGLQILQVGELLTSVPENNPNCYNLPCPDDQQRADEQNRLRAAQLEAISTAIAE